MITQEEVDKYKWWHTIDLGNGVVTKGVCGADHCSEEAVTNRFGIPDDLTGKSVLDIGAANGYFSLEAISRGASSVISIEPNQGGWLDVAGQELLMKHWQENRVSGCMWAWIHNALGEHTPECDISFYFGVLYHVENPIQELRYLRSVTREYALIETAIHQGEGWLFRPGWEGDNSNYWYCSISSLEVALKFVGFTSVELIWTDGIRCTVKASVNAPTGDTGGDKI